MHWILPIYIGVNLQTSSFFYRKEVIHLHLPVQIPCYDLVPIAEFGLIPPRCGGASAAHDFVGLTGGVCKTRERIHRDLLIRDYYRFRVHGVELQTPIPTETKFQGFASPHEVATRCFSPL